VIVGEPLDIAAVDILSGLPTTKEEHRYILVVTDYFMKWSAAYAMRALYDNFFSRFGLPVLQEVTKGRYRHHQPKQKY